MAEILGIGCSHAPQTLLPPEKWHDLRQIIFRPERIPNYKPSASAIAEFGDDNGLTHDRTNHKKIMDAFAVLRDKLHAWKPDLMVVIGDDQAENFKNDNLPVFALYTGAEAFATPFFRKIDAVNNWGAPPDARYTFSCPQPFAQDMRDFLINDGIDITSANELKGWEHGLAHAIINPLLFLNMDGTIPVLPLFVNCLGEEAGPGYPPRPTAKRSWEVGRSIRRFLDTRAERVAIVCSSSWSHAQLTYRYDRCAFDEESNRRTLEWLKEGNLSKTAERTPEDIYLSGDHEFLNWILGMGAIGDGKPANIVEVLSEQSQISFKVFCYWE
jgi:hypothetical protein